MISDLTLLAKNETFSVDSINEYNLIIELQETQLRFCVLHGNTIMWLEDHFLEPETAQKSQIESLIDNHQFISAQYWKSITVCLKASKFSIIPLEFFNETKAKDYLFLSKKNLKNYNLGYISVPILNSILVAASLKEEQLIFTNKYLNTTINFATDAEQHISNLENTENLSTIWFSKYSALISTFADNKFEGTYRIPLKKQNIQDYFSLMLSTSTSIKEYRAKFHGEITTYSKWYSIFNKNYAFYAIQEPKDHLIFARNFQNLPLHRYICIFTLCEKINARKN